jgi:epoxyqueuosine reductase
MGLEDRLLEKAEELRIDLIGFSMAEKTSYGEIVRERIARELIPEQIISNTECFRIPETYSDPRQSMAGARTLICVGQAYYEYRQLPRNMARRGAIARHVWRDSYTDIASKRDGMIEHLRSLGFKAERAKVHPREAARLCGLAWIGRNSFAINPVYGSWALYYGLVTDAEVEPTPRIERSCPKNCRMCMDACPTKALVEPYVLDVSRCLNYLLEKDGPMPEWARDAVGNRVNGCDRCQEACPMNVNAKPAPQPITARGLDPELVPYPELPICFEVTEEQMKANYAHMDWYEPTTRYLKRNALIAVGNSGERELLSLAKRYSDSPDEMLKDHARWALSKLQ